MTMNRERSIFQNKKSNTVINTPFPSGDLVPHSPIAMYTCNAKGYITQYNRAAAELWGAEPVTGAELWPAKAKLFYADGNEMSVECSPMVLALSTTIKNDTEILIENSKGERIVIAPYCSLLFDATGNITGSMNMLVNITERRKNEADAATYKAIVQSSDDAIISKTLSGVITSWNPAAERIFGYTAEEMIGETLYKIIPDDRVEEEPLILQRLQRGERIEHFETQRITKDKRLLDLSLTISPVKDNNGNIIGASKIARDITEKKNAIRRIREGEERLRMAISSTGIGTWDYNVATGDLSWSPECKAIFGISDDIKVTLDLFYQMVHPDDLEYVRTNFDSGFETGDYDVAFRFSRYSDKQLRWVKSQGKVYYKDTTPDHYIGIVLDVTEERAAKQLLENTVHERTIDLEKAKNALERTNNELEEFAYVASHDLQEPLRKIKVFADRIRIKAKDKLPEDVQADLSKIISSSEKMSVLIKDLLNYATAQPAQLVYQSIDLNAVLQSVQEDLDITITNKQATITSDKLPVIEAIPLQMNQLFYNLLNNSLKFALTGRPVAIDIRVLPPTAEELNTLHLDNTQEYCKLVFKDNGIGFSDAHAQRIFTIFQRLNNKDTYPGTGIGLALCKKVVDNHNGRIYAKGKENEGASFTVILPLHHSA
ncbi:MAG: PAS domain S-box protein [Bacteroidetes bacterium]|nr:PAS domain S-box protein [Bacteroidota bacterium]